MKTIFIVDDSELFLTLAKEALVEQYEVIPLASAKLMFEELEKTKPDMILLDVEMPGMTGFEAMSKLKADDSPYLDIPVIFLTGLSDTANEARGIELGAVDFISKPFSKIVLNNRIRNHLEIDQMIRERTEYLEKQKEELEEQAEQLVCVQTGLVQTFADVVESRDPCTGGHIERTAAYMDILIKAMLEREIYAEEIRGWNIDSVTSSARLHDVGKITISNNILNKPERLTEEEFDIIKTHTKAGAQIINGAMKQASGAEVLCNARLIAAHHHERWDGSGYPNGLAGEDIPLQGRLMAIVDVYDALVSERPYKKPFPHDIAMSIIVNDSGRHFDPNIVTVFKEVSEQVDELRLAFSQQKMNIDE
ncbi:MAG: response regulator [Lachnospiraceae bacterium]|nr:response regulator [Lachnospiraceae bacterium]